MIARKPPTSPPTPTGLQTFAVVIGLYWGSGSFEAMNFLGLFYFPILGLLFLKGMMKIYD